MNDNDIVLLFCNVDTAEELLAKDESVGPALVVSDSIPKGEAIVVKKEEFLDWLYEKKEEENGKS